MHALPFLRHLFLHEFLSVLFVFREHDRHQGHNHERGEKIYALRMYHGDKVVVNTRVKQRTTGRGTKKPIVVFLK